MRHPDEQGIKPILSAYIDSLLVSPISAYKPVSKQDAERLFCATYYLMGCKRTEKQQQQLVDLLMHPTISSLAHLPLLGLRSNVLLHLAREREDVDMVDYLLRIVEVAAEDSAQMRRGGGLGLNRVVEDTESAGHPLKGEEAKLVIDAQELDAVTKNKMQAGIEHALKTFTEKMKTVSRSEESVLVEVEGYCNKVRLLLTKLLNTAKRRDEGPVLNSSIVKMALEAAHDAFKSAFSCA